jgi:tRNA A-37 threonylcarbamoyl transferase component Bud32
MSLTLGTHLGSYVIVAPLGMGGMGEVYQARDLKLGRQVAVKILRGDVADDPERRARFEREARLLAAVNHPNIATLYGLEEVEGTRFLVMEFVAGETLAQRLAGGPLDPAEIFLLGRQIAKALAAAHELGIIHRDLKPANVKVTPDRIVKVLDFGLAKAVAVPTDGSQTTESFQNTGEGVILGTPAYMSPEQVRGQTADKRTDIWSFACVLYEMLSGRPPFRGDTAADVFAAILEREPDWTVLPPAVPAGLRDALQRCLRKDPSRRPRDVADLWLLIEEAAGSANPASLKPIAPVPGHQAVQASRTLIGADAGTGASSGERELLERAVFVTRLKQLLRTYKRPALDGCLVYFVFVASLAVGAIAGFALQKGRESPVPILLGLLGGLGTAAAMTWGLSKLALRSRQRSIQKKIDLIVQQCPAELQRWGGTAALADVVAVEGILHILGSAGK